MVERVEKIADPETDSVRIYTIYAACNRIIKIIGTGEVTADQEVYIVWDKSAEIEAKTKQVIENKRD